MEPVPTSEAVPQRESSTAKKVLIIVGIVAGALLLMCGLCVAGAFLFVRYGVQQASQMVRQAIETHPAVVERVGTIHRMEWRMMESQKSGSQQVWPFEFEAERGRGTIEVYLDSSGQTIQRVDVVLSSGERFDDVLEGEVLRLGQPAGK